jgi:hypothetical protein
MELDPMEWTQSDLLRDGSIETLTSALYTKLLHDGDRYVDVGAHVGYHTLLARHCIGAEGSSSLSNPNLTIVRSFSPTGAPTVLKSGSLHRSHWRR